MFSARYLLRKAKETFGRRHHASKKSIILQAVAAVVLFAILWTISAMGPLRTFLPNAFQILGWPGTERTYLVLFQNNAELRATGGFITAYGIVHFKNGLPEGISFYDVYGEIDDHGFVEAPYPMEILLEDNEYYVGYTFRDANFNPDFPEAVNELLNFYTLTHPDTEIDGVFAVNFSVLEDVLALYEPITVDNLELDKRNLFETLETAVSDIDRHNVEELSTRKEIIKDFAYVLIKKMIKTPWKWRELSEIITQNLKEKEILLTFENDTLSKKTAGLGWDGSLPEIDHRYSSDVLAVNVSNFGGLKSDRYITRSINYTVEVTDRYDEYGERLVYGDLEVTLHHYGDDNPPLSGNYTGYLRVFVPEGAELVESSTEDSHEESLESYTGWGDMIEIAPGQTATYTYRIRLSPQYFENDSYQLTVVKQPGTSDDLYEVSLKLPEGMGIESEGFDTRENVGLYRGNLNQNLTLEARFLDDETGPRLFWHEMTRLNVIGLIFAEDVDPESAEDPLNYEIIDLDVNHPEGTDEISINLIQVEGGIIKIYTGGMTVQDEEHYQILMRNIRDLNGNYIQPNPRTITVVQRF